MNKQQMIDKLTPYCNNDLGVLSESQLNSIMGHVSNLPASMPNPEIDFNISNGNLDVEIKLKYTFLR